MKYNEFFMQYSIGQSQLASDMLLVYGVCLGRSVNRSIDHFHCNQIVPFHCLLSRCARSSDMSRMHKRGGCHCIFGTTERDSISSPN